MHYLPPTISSPFPTSFIRQETPTEIDTLKISVRLLNEEDIINRQLPKDTTGAVITRIAPDSPINYLEVNNIIVEVQKIKIKNIKQMSDIVSKNIDKGDKTLLLVIYNNQNQRRYLGIKLQ